MMVATMRVLAFLTCLLVSVAAAAQTPRPSPALTPQIESILRTIKAADKGLLSVSEEDGRWGCEACSCTRTCGSVRGLRS